MKKFIKRLFGIEEKELRDKNKLLNSSIDSLYKKICEIETADRLVSIPIEGIRQMTKREGQGAGTCEKYLGSIANMEKWFNFYQDQKEQIDFIKYMQSHDGIDMFQILESLESEFEQIRIAKLEKTPGGRKELNEERRKNLAS